MEMDFVPMEGVNVLMDSTSLLIVKMPYLISSPKTTLLSISESYDLINLFLLLNIFI